MPNAPLYPNNYPGPGQFALLCEGDRTGYEAALLGRWLRERSPTAQTVDVWPCGTGEGLFATADAIGRTVRVVVIEDRDFRSVEQAQADSERKFADREERNLAMRGWMTWSRNEIENYFLDREVLFPAMRKAFCCLDDDVERALAKALETLVVFQAVKAATAAADGPWSTLARIRHQGGGRPKWKADGLVAPRPAMVKGDLENRILDLQKKAYADEGFQEPFSGQRLLAEFDARIQEWDAGSVAEAVWKSCWAGKETLKLTRQILSSRFSAPIESQRTLIAPVNWHEIGRGMKSQQGQAAQDALDRDIERAMQPVMIEHLWSHLEVSPNADINVDLDALGSMMVW